jgi:SAM-dependent methyltransferase
MDNASHLYTRSFETGLSDKYATVRNLLPPGASVLELGCADGYFSAALTREGFDVVGLESQPAFAETARARGIDVRAVDLNEPGALASLGCEFDAVLAMDVLEHLVDPESAVKALATVIKPGGLLIITGPNVAYWSMRWMLLTGRWTYNDAGIMDRTHLRWFALSDWVKLAEAGGLRTVASGSAEVGMFPLQHLLQRLPGGKSLVKFVASALTKRLPSLFATVLLVVAVKA